MRETTRIATPENVELEFRLAGLGSRFLAFIIDTAIELALYTGLVVLSLGAGRTFGAGEALSSWATVVLVFAYFAVRWGYFLVFEIRMRGQTPGKRALGIRVVRSNGLPLGARQSLLRNLLRIVDSLPPPFCLVGAVSVVASRKGQRLGDLAAGTVVIRERFRASREPDTGGERAAGWVSRIEQGRSRAAVLLPRGPVSIAQVALIEEYFRRLSRLDAGQRRSLSWQIAAPLLPLVDAVPSEWEQAVDRLPKCETLLQEILDLARRPAAHAPEAPEAAGAVAADEPPPASPQESAEAGAKARAWAEFSQRTDQLLRRGRRALAKLSPASLRQLLVGHRGVTSDLARAQSMGADPATLERLNRMAISGHALIYGYAKPARKRRPWSWVTAFPSTLRSSAWALALSAFLLFCPALICAIAVRVDPSAVYDLVGPDFYDFHPASGTSLHSFPQLMRPVVASSVMTNNLQVAILAFAFGLTAGLGTAYLLIVNGMHLGAVIGWLSLQGQARSAWGWIMPHGGTELMAIVIAGASGFLIAKSIIAPGQVRRAAALRVSALRALVLELGCMAMLVVAGIIEGFLSPSGLGFAARMAFAAAMILLWLVFFLFVGRRHGHPLAGGRG